jgi:hypothetical protein
MSASIKSYGYFFITLFGLIFFIQSSVSADMNWQASNERNKTSIEHKVWQQLLDKYLVSSDASGVNLFAYGKVSKSDKKSLQHYLNKMQAQTPTQFNKAEQKAYWINLYNALTVQLILDNYPLKSITKLGGNLFSFGPWDDDAAIVSGEALSLNDIEHTILRPIFTDPRIHYAVNCASYSCPNLSAQAFTANNTEQELDKGARAYVNHARGVKIQGDVLLMSSIYHWYIDDFGGDESSLIKHFKQYASKDLHEKLTRFENLEGNIEHDYDWNLNEFK